MVDVKILTAISSRFVLCAALSLTISACGGSDSASTVTPKVPTTPTPPIGTIDDEFTSWLTDLSHQVILPNYLTLQLSSEVMAVASQTFCDLNNPTQNGLTSLRSAWRELNLAWQQAQWVRIGPILDHNRNLRIQFWPDSKNIVTRDLETLLAEPAVVDVAYIASRSVGGQGLPALELLLFPTSTQNSLTNTSASNNQAKRCEVLKAISENVKNISTDVYQEWHADSGNYVNSVISGTGEFTSVKDSVEELITNWLEQIERVKDDKMLIPLDTADDASLIEFYLSDAALVSIKANVTIFKEIYTNGEGHGFDEILIDFLAQDTIATQMINKIDAVLIAITTIESLSGSYTHLLNDAEGRVAIENAIQKMRELRDIVSIEFVQAADINIGFNSNDGD
ncbi:MAG: imelysin family protein [Colwellia sp.]|nr:imelysin family protein [Colwellia sp.]